MLLDARSVPQGEVLTYDLCIVGAGAAGITIAQEFNGTALRVLLLESGGLRPSRPTQRLYTGQIVDEQHHGALDRYRVRRFGGTTSVWGGCCAPFDASDFRPRTGAPYSGWPIAKADLDPFYARAHTYCQLGAYVYDAGVALPGPAAPAVPGMTDPDVASNTLWRFSPPTNFGKVYRQALQRSANVHVCLHANVLKLIADAPHHVSRAKVASLRRNEFSVQARAFVLAAGGLETTRLLLLSDDLHRHGLGNTHGLVGRCYMSHLTGDVGEIELRPRGGAAVWNYETTTDGVYCRRLFSIAPARREADGLLNFGAILDRLLPADPSHGDAVLSAIYLLKHFRNRTAACSLRGVAAHCGNIAADPWSLMRFSVTLARKRFFRARRLPSAVPQGRGDRYTLHFDAEQSPNPDSRVVLGDGRDAFGLRQLKVDWRFSEADVESAVKSALIIDRAFRQSGVGRLLLGPHALRERIAAMTSVGSHHLGTTRMAGDPTKGVVDAHCRVHETANLFIASSSVFPTSSYARPTLTAVALAIRLADHVKDLFAGAGLRAGAHGTAVRPAPSAADGSEAREAVPLAAGGASRVGGAEVCHGQC